MKKAFLAFLLASSTSMLTSCKVNYFHKSVDVPWYYVVLPVTFIFIVTYIVLMSKSYICPRCNTVFKAKPHQLYVTVHFGNQRIAKCPHCGRKGFCRVKKGF